MRLNMSVSGPVAVDEVWDRYLVPARWPEWAPQIRAVETGDKRLAVGTSGRVRGPCGLGVSFIVTDLDEVRRTWAWRVTMGPVHMSLRHGVQSIAEGTSTWLEVDGPLPVVVAYAPLARLALWNLVHRR